MSDMPMEEIRCPFCKSSKGVDRVDREACDACEECDEYGMIGLPYEYASIIWDLNHIILQAAHEAVRGIVIVVENNIGSIEQYRGGHILRALGSDALEQAAKSARKVLADGRIKTAEAKLKARWLCRIGRNKDGKLVKMNDGTAEARKYGNAVYWAAHLYYEDYDIMHSLCELTRVTFGLAQKADEDDLLKKCELCERAWDDLLAEQKDGDGH